VVDANNLSELSVVHHQSISGGEAHSVRMCGGSHVLVVVTGEEPWYDSSVLIYSVYDPEDDTMDLLNTISGRLENL